MVFIFQLQVCYDDWLKCYGLFFGIEWKLEPWIDIPLYGSEVRLVFQLMFSRESGLLEGNSKVCLSALKCKDLGRLSSGVPARWSRVSRSARGLCLAAEWAAAALSSRSEAAAATTSLAPAHRPSTTRPSEVCDCDCVLVITLPPARSGTSIPSPDGIIRPPRKYCDFTNFNVTV